MVLLTARVLLLTTVPARGRTKGYPVVEPKFEWTLEWVLPTPVPLHQFAESPVVVEVINRNPDGGHH